ncbi:hypothetical protein B0T26DRAFT_653162 [Lasiosphaeria miniovina]|uniref:3beta-hydroxysteroid 3-dehydrogenase n=1 Tax=Lasiosphaeria miniovina TaxID=1954250 RepID=A0AA40A693_9PEZI|nr:uncharacterized protein B0T26DRAFT_653162 [Lasiosphaeria miniovina]KAK0710022.1 hypothetical protein B0T26DRAFT_653162 [Lasiosphaeria miniovina]
MTTTTRPGSGSVLITGANGGFGCGIVSKMVSTPELAVYHGIYTTRDGSSAPALKTALASATAKSHSHEVLSLDLSRLASVREVAAGINARVASGKLPPIRALILNAAYNDLGQQAFTEDGFDMGFAATYLGHWLLTLLLLQSMDRQHGRVVVVGGSSYDVHHPIHKLGGYYKDKKWQTLINGDSIDAVAEGTWSSNNDDAPSKAGVRRYGAAKMCAVMMLLELQKRLDADPALSSLSVVGIDPGSMATGIVRRGDWFTRTVLFPVVVPALAPVMAWSGNPTPTFRSVSRSADDLLSAAFDSDPARLRGRYLDGSQLKDVSPEAADEAKRAVVWRDSVKYTHLTSGDTMLVNWA